MRIKDIMTPSTATCCSADSLNVAARLMWESDCGSIPVTAENGELVGMITDRDICMAAYTQGVPLSSMLVGNTMAKQVLSCQSSASLEAAEQLMSENQIRRVPIVDDKRRVVGILSLSDLARYAAAQHKNGIDREVVQVLAALGRPHASGSPRTVQPRAAVAIGI